MALADKPWSDSDIQTAVGDELAWTPTVDRSKIGIAVDGGIVTLSGEVGTYAIKLAALRAAVRIHGVTAMVDNVVVHPGWSSILTEPDIAREVEHALKWAENVPDTVKAQIKNHDVTLTGSVEWFTERRAAEGAVQHLTGVNHVANMITLTPRASAPDTTHRIKQAFARSAQIDADAITVDVSGSTVKLTGTVRTMAERAEAERAAWSSPHVTDVEVGILVQAGQ